MRVVDRITRITPSATIELEGIVAELEAAGKPVIGLNVGEPDFQTPDHVRVACDAAIGAGKTRYVSVTGIIELRRAICEKLASDNGVAYAPNEIVVSTGAKQALYNAILTIVAPGDEVIIPIPAWVSYVEMVKLAEAKPVLVPTQADYHLDLDAIEAAVTSKTRVILLNTPNNPTGAVYTEAELRALADLAVRRDLYIITDEVYEKLVYDKNRHFCIASISEEVRARTVIVNGFSKAYAMTGWRIGYAACPSEVARGMASLQGHTTSNSTTPVQWAALQALKGPQNTIETMRQNFDRRRVYLLERLREIEGIRCQNAEGAFYLLPDVSHFYGMRDGSTVIQNSEDFCSYLLREAQVAVVPGAAFYAPNTVRIAYSNSIENIGTGMDRIAAALQRLH